MIRIDGSAGEGGGQVLRSALTLSALTRRSFTIEGIRAGRKRPGLLRQHLAAVQAAAAICEAETDGATPGSTELRFAPRRLAARDVDVAIGGAGSTGLVLQTVLLPLCFADAPSRVVLEGGTHNPMAPPFPYLDRVFLPLLCRMGARVEARLVRPGFYPAGGGRVEVEVEPCAALEPIEIVETAPTTGRLATAIVAHVPRHVGERELHVLASHLGWPESSLRLVEATDSVGPGNVLLAEVERGSTCEMFTSFGSRGVSAERVATDLAREVRSYLSRDAPVGPHLADQLLLPLALAGGGAFVTGPLSLHARTNVEVIARFLDVRFAIEERDDRTVRVDVHGVRFTR